MDINSLDKAIKALCDRVEADARDVEVEEDSLARETMALAELITARAKFG